MGCYNWELTKGSKGIQGFVLSYMFHKHLLLTCWSCFLTTVILAGWTWNWIWWRCRCEFAVVLWSDEAWEEEDKRPVILYEKYILCQYFNQSLYFFMGKSVPDVCRSSTLYDLYVFFCIFIDNSQKIAQVTSFSPSLDKFFVVSGYPGYQEPQGFCSWIEQWQH